jgi:hypothetical protein
MRQVVLFGSMLLLLLVASLCGADESPLAKAAVGDWVEFQGDAPRLDGLVKTDTKLTIRYTVKAKTDKVATLNVKSWSGELEMADGDFDVPLDQPFNAALLAPTASDKVNVKLEKTVPNLKYKIKGKEFQGTAYQYKMGVDLFSGLGFPAGEEKGKKVEKAKNLEISLSYFVSPDAPVLGIALFSVSGLTSVRYELSDGTGVGPLLYPPPPPKVAKHKVGDWLEYRGVNRGDEREIVLRHTVKAISAEETTMAAELAVDGKSTESWEFTVPGKNVLAFAPRWQEFGDVENRTSLRRTGDYKRTFDVLDNIRLKGTADSFQITLNSGKKSENVWVSFGVCFDLPLTGLAVIGLRSNKGIDVELLLAKQSGFLEVKSEPKYKTGSSSARLPSNSKTTPKEKSGKSMPKEKSGKSKK